jgi:hypothetical protein
MSNILAAKGDAGLRSRQVGSYEVRMFTETFEINKNAKSEADVESLGVPFDSICTGQNSIGDCGRRGPPQKR